MVEAERKVDFVRDNGKAEADWKRLEEAAAYLRRGEDEEEKEEEKDEENRKLLVS